jgi:hypothetical protein
VDEAKAIVVDGQGNAFVTGYSVGADNSWEFLTLNYSTAGVPLWTNRYSGMMNSSDTATAMALDPAGNVVVTGISQGAGTGDDIATIVYSNNGVPLSTNRYASDGNYSDQANAVATDRSGNILIAGLSETPTEGNDFTVIRYSSSGAPSLMIQRLPGAVVLSWANPFTLQAAARLGDAFTNVPGATSPFTNFISAPQEFFRLIPK